MEDIDERHRGLRAVRRVLDVLPVLVIMAVIVYGIVEHRLWR